MPFLTQDHAHGWAAAACACMPLSHQGRVLHVRHGLRATGLWSSCQVDRGLPSSPTVSTVSCVFINLGSCRWNAVAAPQIGASAQLLPMLLGFSTYKAAILGRGSVDILGDITSSKPDGISSTDNAGNAS